MSSFALTIIAFVVALTILIFVHEFGHFWVARLLKIKVLRFSIGFGKPLLTWRDKLNTEYVIAALPLGGYVKMLDEREAEVAEAEKPFAFNLRPVSHRILVVIAGPVFNLLFAILAYWLMFSVGVMGVKPIVGDVIPSSIAAKANMVSGEEIIAVDNKTMQSWEEITVALVDRIGDKGSLKVTTAKPNGNTSFANDYVLQIDDWKLLGDKPDAILSLGIKPYVPEIPAVVGRIMSNSAASGADIQPGDEFVSINNEAVASWQQFVEIVQQKPNEKVDLKIKRGDMLQDVTLTLGAKPGPTGEEIGMVGVYVKSEQLPEELMRKIQYGPIDSLINAGKRTWNYTLLTFEVLGKMIIGKVALSNLSGPITIAQGAGQTALIGFSYYLGFLALISISLGVINLLPIPILDGGHLFFYAIEAVKGKPVSEKIQLIGFKVGMIILLGVMGIAFYNDIVRL